MPTARHFWKRQNWHRFRLLLSTGQSLLARQTYLEFFWTVRCKKKKKKGITLRTFWRWTFFLLTCFLFLICKCVETNLTRQILLPWKTLYILHRCVPRSADRRRCHHTRHSSPHFHWDFSTWAISCHSSGQCCQGCAVAPSPWRDSSVPRSG